MNNFNPGDIISGLEPDEHVEIRAVKGMVHFLGKLREGNCSSVSCDTF